MNFLASEDVKLYLYLFIILVIYLLKSDNHNLIKIIFSNFLYEWDVVYHALYILFKMLLCYIEIK